MNSEKFYIYEDISLSLRTRDYFHTLLENFIEINRDVEALIVSDKDGLIIAGEKRKDVDMEIISVLTTIIIPILEKIREEFSFKKFGTASFDTDEHRLLFITIDEETILSLVLNNMASIDKISPYAYFLAEKSAQILTAKEGDNVQIAIPNFEYDAESTERLKNQIYQMRLDSGGRYRFKFVIIGDFAVGKTSIVRRYVDQTYSVDYRSTIGLNVMVHSFKFLGNEVSLALYDIGAQAYFKRLRKMYYRGAQAAFIVFDLSNRESYENATKWFEELIDFIDSKDLPI
ncbi:MAG: GTP-binding protein, partial [Promethearchaeota archaeon]